MMRISLFALATLLTVACVGPTLPPPDLGVSVAMEQVTTAEGAGTRITFRNHSSTTIYLSGCSLSIQGLGPEGWVLAHGASCVAGLSPVARNETREVTLGVRPTGGTYRAAAGYRTEPEGQNRFVHGDAIEW